VEQGARGGRARGFHPFRSTSFTRPLIVVHAPICTPSERSTRGIGDRWHIERAQKRRNRARFYARIGEVMRSGTAAGIVVVTVVEFSRRNLGETSYLDPTGKYASRLAYVPKTRLRYAPCFARSRFVRGYVTRHRRIGGPVDIARAYRRRIASPPMCLELRSRYGDSQPSSAWNFYFRYLESSPRPVRSG